MPRYPHDCKQALGAVALVVLAAACRVDAGPKVTIAEDSAVFAAGLAQLRQSGETPRFVDPRPAQLDSLGLRERLKPENADTAIIVSRARILRALGISPEPFVLQGRCDGVFVAEARRTEGCPSEGVVAAEVSTTTRRGGEFSLMVAVRTFGPAGSVLAAQRYVFKNADGRWALVRVEPGIAVD